MVNGNSWRKRTSTKLQKQVLPLALILQETNHLKDSLFLVQQKVLAIVFVNLSYSYPVPWNIPKLWRPPSWNSVSRIQQIQVPSFLSQIQLGA